MIKNLKKIAHVPFWNMWVMTANKFITLNIIILI